MAALILALILMPIHDDAPKEIPKTAGAGAKKPLEGRPPYELVRDRAIKENRVLLVFVNCHPDLAMGTALKHYTTSFPGCENGSCIVVGTPHKGDLYRSDHKADATELTIMESVMSMKSVLKARDARAKAP